MGLLFDVLLLPDLEIVDFRQHAKDANVAAFWCNPNVRASQGV